jgi:hypothetical protein
MPSPPGETAAAWPGNAALIAANSHPLDVAPAASARRAVAIPPPQHLKYQEATAIVDDAGGSGGREFERGGEGGEGM